MRRPRAWAGIAGTLLALLLLGAGCRMEAVVPPGATSPAGTAAPATTPTSLPDVPAIARPQYYFSYYNLFPYPLTAPPLPAATISAVATTAITLTSTAPPPTTVPATTVVAGLDELSGILRRVTDVFTPKRVAPPDVPAALAPELDGKVAVFYSLPLLVYRHPATNAACATFELYLSVRNLMTDKVLSGITFAYTYRDRDGAVLQEGTASLSFSLRPASGSYDLRNVRYFVPPEAVWPAPGDLDVAGMTAEVRVLGISCVDL